jgi:hypothetical protein
VLVVVYLMAAAVVRHKVNTMLADMECEVLEVVPTLGDRDLNFQAVVQVRTAFLQGCKQLQGNQLAVCGVVDDSSSGTPQGD